MNDYAILVSHAGVLNTAAYDLEILVRTAIKDGWELQGGVSVAVDERRWVFSQAVARPAAGTTRR